MLMRLLLSQQHSQSIFDHVVVSLTRTGLIGQRLIDAGIHVHAINLKGIFNFPFAFFRLLLLMRKLRPSIVQTWMYHADLIGGIAARMASIKAVIWGIRTTDLNSRGPRATSLIRKLCAKLSYFIPVSIVCAADASRLAHIIFGYDASRMVVVRNGFDLARLVATPQETGALRLLCDFDAGDVVIGFVGRFHSDKDQLNFVQAAGLVSRQYENARFLMVGRGLNACNEKLMQWIRNTGYSNRFVLLGERTDVPVCLAATDLFCLSSRTEGFPNVVAEAMAMGVPCVVTDVGDAALLVADTGVVVPKEDSDALALGLGQLLAMPPIARELLGQKAKMRVQIEFSMARCNERFEAVYQNVITVSQK